MSTDFFERNITILQDFPPYFTGIPANASLEFAIDPLFVDFNASDDIAVDSWSVNDTVNFKINDSGILENNTVLAVGKLLLHPLAAYARGLLLKA